MAALDLQSAALGPAHWPGRSAGRLTEKFTARRHPARRRTGQSGWESSAFRWIRTGGGSTELEARAVATCGLRVYPRTASGRGIVLFCSEDCGSRDGPRRFSDKLRRISADRHASDATPRMACSATRTFWRISRHAGRSARRARSENSDAVDLYGRLLAAANGRDAAGSGRRLARARLAATVWRCRPHVARGGRVRARAGGSRCSSTRRWSPAR